MKTVLAVVDNSAVSRPVLSTALALAPLANASAEAIHVAAKLGHTARGTAELFDVPFREVPGRPP
jgi:hypothetical protein